MGASRDFPSDAKRSSAVEEVVRTLSLGLMTYRFAPGQRLVEADLTTEFNVSRGTLREAFRRLAADGLIEMVPNRGAIVRRLSRRDVAELFQIRSELEGLAARLAAARIATPAVRSAFEAAIAPIWSDAPRYSISTYMEENTRFHEAVHEAGGNNQLTHVSRQLQLPAIMNQVSRLLTPRTLEASVSEHRRIARAILAGDAAEADRQMRIHLARAADLNEETVSEAM